jgi:endonuclease/exonuclease/phosphatase (EEP) superfamily protein YafD
VALDRPAALSEVIAPVTGHLIGFGLAAGLAVLACRRVMFWLMGGVVATVAFHAWLGLARCCEGPNVGTSSSLTQLATHTPRRKLTVLALEVSNATDAQAMARELIASTADILVLSGVDPRRSEVLNDLHTAYPFQAKCVAQSACSLALLARVPFKAHGAARMAPESSYFVWARLADSLTIIGTALPPAIAAPWQHEQDMSALAQLVRRLDGAVILAGALNTSPWSGSYRMLRKETGLVPTSTLLPSWPARPFTLPQVGLDHILVSPELDTIAAGAGPLVGSDHLPVWARVERRPEFDQPRRWPRQLASGTAVPRAHLGSELLADLGSEHGGARDLRR